MKPLNQGYKHFTWELLKPYTSIPRKKISLKCFCDYYKRKKQKLAYQLHSNYEVSNRINKNNQDQKIIYKDNNQN